LLELPDVPDWLLELPDVPDWPLELLDEPVSRSTADLSVDFVELLLSPVVPISLEDLSWLIVPLSVE